MTVTRGIDVSHWSGSIDYPTLRKQPQAGFVIAKCTEGVEFLDSQYQANRSGSIGQEIPFAAYHFYRHNGRPQDQADWFVSNIGDVEPTVAVCDVETTLLVALYGYAWRQYKGMNLKDWQTWIILTRASASKYTDAIDMIDMLDAIATLESDVNTFCDRLVWHGLEPVIYTSPGFAQSFFKTNLLSKWPLWVAHIGVQKPTIPAPWAQYGGWPDNPKVPIWQDTWTLKVEGIPEAAVDGNLFTSAAGDLYDWFGNGTPYEEPGVIPGAIRVNTPGSYANIRNKVWGTITGKAPHGMTLFVTDQAHDVNGKLWYACGTGWVAGWICEAIG